VSGSSDEGFLAAMNDFVDDGGFVITKAMDKDMISVIFIGNVQPPDPPPAECLALSWHVVPGGMWLVPGGLTIVLNSFTPLSCSCSCSLDVTIPSISQLQEPAPCTCDIIGSIHMHKWLTNWEHCGSTISRSIDSLILIPNRLLWREACYEHAESSATIGWK
jgi:hypothetical protein